MTVLYFITLPEISLCSILYSSTSYSTVIILNHPQNNWPNKAFNRGKLVFYDMIVPTDAHRKILMQQHTVSISIWNKKNNATPTWYSYENLLERNMLLRSRASWVLHGVHLRPLNVSLIFHMYSIKHICMTEYIENANCTTYTRSKSRKYNISSMLQEEIYKISKWRWQGVPMPK